VVAQNLKTEFRMAGHDDSAAKYTTPYRVQAWFLGRSREEISAAESGGQTPGAKKSIGFANASKNWKPRTRPRGRPRL